MQRITFSLVSLLAVIILVLLVQQRINSTPVQYAVEIIETVGTVTDLSKATKFKRGSIVQTGPESKILLKINRSHIALYENTELELDQLTADKIILNLIKGRIAVNSVQNKITVKTNHTESTAISGAMSVVNYDFQRRVSVIPFQSLIAVIANEEYGILTKTPVNISEISPFTVVDTEFNAENSSAADFYSWFHKKTDASIISQRSDYIPE